MNERIKDFGKQAYDAGTGIWPINSKAWYEVYNTTFAELILANADELKRMMNTDPINKPFELNPKFIAKCDELGRSRRQFQ